MQHFALCEADEWVDPHLTTPFVITGGASAWPAAQWNEKEFSEKLGGMYRVRFGSRNFSIGKPLFDASCTRSYMLMEKFFEWSHGGLSTVDNDMILPDINDCWGYMDYIHLAENPNLTAETRNAFLWSSLLGDDGMTDDVQTTVWLGSVGAHSPLHYDAMGWNLHAQLRGRKQWILVPPRCPGMDKESYQRKLRPTRFPYEDTTIYSKLDALGDPSCLSSIADVRVFDLRPGDILFIPPLWWHATLCCREVDGSSPISISANVWLNERNDVLHSITERTVDALICLFQQLLNISDRIAGEASCEGDSNCTFATRMETMKMELMQMTEDEQLESALDDEEYKHSWNGRLRTIRKRGRSRYDSFLSRFSHFVVPPKTTKEELDKLYTNGSRDHSGLIFNKTPIAQHQFSFSESIAYETLSPWNVERLVKNCIKYRERASIDISSS